MPIDIQNSIVEILQEENTIVFVMGHTGKYLSLLGGTNRALYSDGSMLIGKSYPDVLVKEKADYLQSLLDKVMETNQPLEVEYELSSTDFIEEIGDGSGVIQRFRGNLFPMDSAPQEDIRKVVWVVHNITNQKS